VKRTALAVVLPVALGSCWQQPPLEVCLFEDGGADAAVRRVPPPVGDLAGLDMVAPPPAPCPAPSKWIFTVDENGTLSRFLPDTLAFQDLGPIHCPTMLDGQPNSMAIARDGNGWVVYSTGELFRLDTTTLQCTATSYVPGQLGFTNYSMSFAEDTPGGVLETLFVADIPQAGTVAELGRVNLSSFALQFAANIGGTDKPELTGDDHANLWGFFPSGTDTPKVARIDKKSGALDLVFPLPSLSGSATDWAFAAWGDAFYIFLRKDFEASTSIYRLTMDGNLVTVVPDTGRKIPGVGVAVCAGQR
jgi:hypothetical protein